MTMGRRGAAAAEFVLVVPLFFLIIFATIDVVRVFRAQIRMEMIAVQIGQIVSQCSRITPEDFTHSESGFWALAARIADGRVNVNSPGGGTIIISALGRDGNRNRLYWQERPSTGNTTTQSVFGTTANATPTLRGRDGEAFVIPEGQTLFATEVFATVQPWIMSAGLISSAMSEIRGVTFFLSRSSDPGQLQQQPTAPTPPAPTRSCTQ